VEDLPGESGRREKRGQPRCRDPAFTGESLDFSGRLNKGENNMVMNLTVDYPELTDSAIRGSP